MTILIQYC